MKKYEINPYPRWRTYELEAYLMKKAAKGWKLTDIFGKILIFQKEEPSACEYAVRLFTPKSIRQIEEYQELCESSGWKPITWTDNLQILEKTDPSAIAIDTDEEILLIELKKIRFNSVWKGLLATFIACVFYMVLFLYAGGMLFYTLDLLMALMGIMYVASKIADIIQCFVLLNRVKKEMRIKSVNSNIKIVWNICYVWYRRIIITIGGLLFLSFFVDAVFMGIKGGLFYARNYIVIFIMWIVMLLIMIMIAINGKERVYHARKVKFPLWAYSIYQLVMCSMILFMPGVTENPVENLYTPNMWGYNSTTKDYDSATYESSLIGNMGEYMYVGYGLMDNDTILEQSTSDYKLQIYNTRINILLDRLKHNETKTCTFTYLYELRGVKIFQLDGYIKGYEKQEKGNGYGYDKYYYLEYKNGFCIFRFDKYAGDITDKQVIEGLVDKLEQNAN